MNIVNTGFIEYLDEKTKGLAVDLPWMKGRTLKYCENMEELRAFVDACIQAGRCVLDVEATGLNTRSKKIVDPTTGTMSVQPTDRIVGFSIAYKPDLGIYVPTRHQEEPELNLPEADVLHEIQRLVANCICIFHHAKYDIVIMRNHGIRIDDHKKIEDTMILARLYDAGQKQIGLKDLSKRLLNQEMIEFSDACGIAKRFDLVSPRVGYLYAASDAVCSLDLYNFLVAQPNVQSQQGVYSLEKRVLFVVMAMESNLVKVDVPYLTEFKTKTEARLAEVTKEIYRLIGKEFNIGSPLQLGKVLFEDLRYTYPNKKEEGGKWGTDDDTLSKIKDTYPVIALITEYRELEKVLGTYINNLLANHDEDNCVKFAFNQVGTDTGRFSSPGGKGIQVDGYSGLNVQSLPKPPDKDDEEQGYVNMRRVFIARPGYVILAMDFSNEEMRVAANLSREPVWVDAFLNGEDLHEKSGQIIYGRPSITKAERGVGKTCNFAILYGGGPRRISEVSKCSEAEARRIQAAFFQGLPILKKWMDGEVRKARRTKMVTTAFGRIRPLNYFYDSPDRGTQAHGDRCVCNTQIQGGCADIMKLVMTRVATWIESHNHEKDIRILLTMHDELVYEVREDMLDYFVPNLNQIMSLRDVLQGRLGWPVPLTLDAEWGPSWDVAHDYFKDHPEARNAAPVEFHQEQQVSGRFGIAVAKANTPEPATAPAEAPAEPAKAPETPAPANETPAPQAVQEATAGAQAGPTISGTDIVYTLRDRRESTARLYGLITAFLEKEKTVPAYGGPKRRLVLRDPDGHSLLVDDVFVNSDLFIGLARFLGI